MFLPRDAERLILASTRARPDVEHVPLSNVQGRVLATDVHTDLDQPPFDRVAMDGIALNASNYAAGQREFRIVRTQAAGTAPVPLADAAACIEIMTGAVLPEGTDAVVPVERLTVTDGIARLEGDLKIVPGLNVHRRGLDQPKGAKVLTAGQRLRGPEVAILASAGLSQVAVTRRPRLAVVSTGDELVEPSVVPLPWQVRRSNAYALRSALAGRGYADVLDLHLADDRARIEERLAELLTRVDVLVLSGGVSAGRFDHVPAALAAIGVEQIFHKVAQRPGRPLWFGRTSSGALVFGLPGNPVSTLICLTRYVFAALALLEGAPPAAPLVLPLGAPLASAAGLALFMPVDIRATASGPQADPHPTQGSGDFTALAGTAGFVEIGPDASATPGTGVPFYHW